MSEWRLYEEAVAARKQAEKERDLLLDALVAICDKCKTEELNPQYREEILNIAGIVFLKLARLLGGETEH